MLCIFFKDWWIFSPHLWHIGQLMADIILTYIKYLDGSRELHRSKNTVVSYVTVADFPTSLFFYWIGGGWWRKVVSCEWG